MSAPAHITVRVTTDTRQLARESRLLRPEQVDDLLAGRTSIWMDEERFEDQIVITPRLCFG
ncbi:hypothetical protein [Rhizorhabdus histidinilytica]|jgi:hypothetical protein|uniref:hypothetical protein n=1 Tax=Rhizorhabdus histidinilytica TaxID=439228 RepID=UPI0032209003